MKRQNIIGIISDTHDNLPNVEKAIKIFNDYNTSYVIHCGDFVAPFTLVSFKKLKCPLIGVFGNCDGERDYSLTQAQKLNFTLTDPPYSTIIANKKFIITHKPLIIREPADFLIYGHTHKPEIKYNNNKTTLMINPGEASGWLFREPTVAILNLSSNLAELILL